MTQMARRVVKVGGSLLGWPGLRDALSSWLARQRPAQNIFVAGGGPLVDAVREWQRVHHLTDEAAHWLCVRAMSVSHRLLLGLLPAGTKRVSAWAPFEKQLSQSGVPANFAFDMADFLSHVDTKSATPLPRNWSVTSDSIAARLATRVEASELVLLKSTLPKSFANLAELSASEFADEFFPTAAAALSCVRCVNLRATGTPEMIAPALASAGRRSP